MGEDESTVGRRATAERLVRVGSLWSVISWALAGLFAGLVAITYLAFRSRLSRAAESEQLALERRFLTPAQLQRAKEEQRSLADRGIERSLWFLIQDLGFVSDEQGRELRKYVSSSRVRALEVEGFVIQRRLGCTMPDLRLEGGKVVSGEDILGELSDLLGDEIIDETVEWRHRPTEAVDQETGQGSAHVQYAFAAHRAVVDVDTELGLVKVVALDCVQDVGKAINPQAVLGQIQGGSAQGLGLAVMEEIQISDGKIRNPSFTDYLIPTILDIPPMRIEVLEYPDPNAPYGVRGVGEPPTISSGPAIVAAIRAATGLALNQVPVRPEHITGT